MARNCRYVRTVIHYRPDYRVAYASSSAYCLSLNYTLIDSDCAPIVNPSELDKLIRLISLGELTKMSFAFITVRRYF